MHLFGPHVSPDCWSGCHIYQHLAQSPAAASGGSGLLRGTAKSLGEGRRNEARRRKRKGGGEKEKAAPVAGQDSEDVLLYLEDVR